MQPKEQQTISTFRNNTGQNIFYRNWKIEDKSKGIVLIVHGLNSHSGYYQNFAAQLNENDYEVYAIDLRGRGLSEGERYYIPDYEDIVADIDQLVSIVKSIHAQSPIFLFGHSAGGVFASIYVVKYQNKLRGLISESFAFQVPASGFARAAIKFLSHVIPRTRIVRLNNKDFSRDKSVADTMNNDPLLANEKQPARTMQQLLLAAQYLKTKMAVISLPLLVLHGTADKVTQSGGSEYFIEHVSSADRQLKLYEGHYHDLINDKYNGIIVKDIVRWLNERA